MFQFSLFYSPWFIFCIKWGNLGVIFEAIVCARYLLRMAIQCSASVAPCLLFLSLVFSYLFDHPYRQCPMWQRSSLQNHRRSHARSITATIGFRLNILFQWKMPMADLARRSVRIASHTTAIKLVVVLYRHRQVSADTCNVRLKASGTDEIPCMFLYFEHSPLKTRGWPILTARTS